MASAHDTNVPNQANCFLANNMYLSGGWPVSVDVQYAILLTRVRSTRHIDIRSAITHHSHDTFLFLKLQVPCSYVIS